MLVLFLSLLGGGYLLWDYLGSARAGTSWKTEPETEGAIEVDITASGTLEPEDVIDVGAQVQGQIKFFGRDPAVTSAALTGLMVSNGTGFAPLNAAFFLSDNKSRVITAGWSVVDYNSSVEEGTLLAQLDDAIFRSQVDQAEAALARAQADLQVARLNYELAEGEDSIARSGGKSVTQQELFERQLAVKTTFANVKSAEVNVEQARANLQLAQVNLGYTTIRSPVKGVVIDRRVNVGQTVVASLNAPSLFLIAKDLTRMQIWVSVNEADVGRIQEAMRAGEKKNPKERVKATFTVDSHPGETFKGEVSQIRQNATMTQNVVTYTVIVDTDNRDADGNPGKLLPYMTANVRFKIARKEKVHLVPTAALRYSPTPEQVHPDFRKAYEETRVKRSGGEGGPAPSGPPQGGGGAGAKQQNRGTLWVVSGNFVRPVRVRTGLSDGVRTEVVEVLNNDQLPTGTEVVTGENAPAANGSGGDGTKNPFAPPPIFKRR
jgi:HlyD family secretion protein